MPLTNASLDRRHRSMPRSLRRGLTEHRTLVLGWVEWRRIPREQRSCVSRDHPSDPSRRAEHESALTKREKGRSRSYLEQFRNQPKNVDVRYGTGVHVLRGGSWRQEVDSECIHLEISPWNFKFPKCKTAANSRKISVNSSSENINTLQALLINDHSFASSRLSQ